MTSAHPRRRVRWATRSAFAAWAAITAVDGASAAGVWGWLPTQPHTLAVGICVTATCSALLMRIMVPTEASFIHGMLAERANPGGLEQVERSAVRMASGDDSGGIVMQFPRRPDSSPRHARPDRRGRRPRS